MPANVIAEEAVSSDSRDFHYVNPGRTLRSQSPRHGRAPLGLILRLELSGMLSTEDQEYLDSLAPQGCLTFLLRNRTYAHPRDIELFPIETIETALNYHGDAYFTHHCVDGSTSDSRKDIQIHTSLVCDAPDAHVILGVFGPRNILSSTAGQKTFVTAVSDLRTAYAASLEKVPRIKAILSAPEATVIVDRDDATIVATNEPFLRLAEKQRDRVIGTEFESLRQALGTGTQVFPYSMTDVPVGQNELAILTVREDSTEFRASELIKMLAQRARNENATIARHTQRLKQAPMAIDSEKHHALMNQILERTTAIEHELSRIVALADTDTSPETNQNIVRELEQVIAESKCTPRSRMVINGLVTTPSVVAPRNAVRAVFESVLSRHETISPQSPACTVTIKQGRLPSETSIRFESVCQDSWSTPAEDDRLFLMTLADKVGLRATKCLESFDKSIVTEFTLNR